MQVLTALERLPITGKIEVHLICEGDIPWYMLAAVSGKQNPFTPLGGRILQIYVIHAVLFVPINAYSYFLRGLIGDSLIRQLALIPIAFALTLLLSGKQIKKLFDCVSDRFRIRMKKSDGKRVNGDD